ncbi:ornithine cyclodeaminase mu-crystallin family protein [Moniliophthora roreri]|nr:ornithine cyclodeaminase mu-crystallin family protein [Moniliophthora roreri]
MALRVLTAADVDAITSALSPEYLQGLMADVFALTSSPSSTPPQLYTPHRITIPTENHKVLFMPARIADTGTSIKVVSVPTSAGDTGGIPGSTIVLDKQTGAVKAIVNSRSLTALRNAAGSLLSTTLVGPKEPTHIVTFGAGQQILYHLDIHIKAYPSIRSCTIVNRSLNARLQRVVDTLTKKHSSVKINALANGESTTEVKDAMADASIIITATPSKTPLFPSAWVKTGTHVILIGSYTPEMKEVDRELTMRAVPSASQPESASVHRTISPILLVDSIAACAKEAGELLDAKLNENQLTEIGALVLKARSLTSNDLISSPELEVAGLETKRMRALLWPEKEAKISPSFDGPVTLFKSVGVGLQDVAIACAVVDKAGDIGVIVNDYDTLH